jgi:glucose/arabinose dehydrogenase
VCLVASLAATGLAGCGRAPNPLQATIIAADEQSEPAETATATNTAIVLVIPTATSQPSPTVVPERNIPDPSGYNWQLVAEGFQRPLLLTNAGDGSNRLFVVEQDGQIEVAENGAQLAEPFLDIDANVGSNGNEQGLLGLAFHPDYENNGFLYVNYTDTAGNTVVSRFTASGNTADPSSEMVMLQIEQPYENHNGGLLYFGPDGYLYIGTGDGGSGGDPRNNGQSTETLLGKLLRIDVNAAEPYAIPVDNPFGRGGGLGEIWAYGLRNPWRFSFDRTTGDLYIADVGQGEWEEISFLPGGSAGGANFGWNFFEGTHAYEGDPPSGLIPPVAEYDHGHGCSVTGGHVYRGEMLPEWQGVYVYGDFCSGEMWGLVQHSDGSWENQAIYDTSFLITSFGEDEAGELYVLDRFGALYRLEAN